MELLFENLEPSLQEAVRSSMGVTTYAEFLSVMNDHAEFENQMMHEMLISPITAHGYTEIWG